MVDEDRALTRILRVSRWACVAPYSTLRPPRVSRAYVLYGRLICVFYGALVILVSALDTRGKYRETEILSRRLSLCCLLTISIISITGIVYKGMFNAEIRMRRTFRHLARLKNIRRNMGGKTAADPAIEQVCLFYVAIQIFLLVLNVCDIWVWGYGRDNFLKILIIFSFMTSAYFVTNIVMMQFVIVAMTINSSFRMITDKLQETVHSAQIYDSTEYKDESNFNDSEKYYCFTGSKIPLSTINITIEMLGMVTEDIKEKPQMPHQTIRYLAHAYVSTCEVMRQQYYPETGLLLLLLGSILTNLVNSVYYIIRNIQEYHEVVSLFGVLWCILHICRVLLLVEPNHAMSSEIERCHGQIRKLLHTVRSRDDPLLAELNMFLLHLSLNQPAYMVLGMYTMNRPLILTMLAICTTYLAVFQEFY